VSFHASLTIQCKIPTFHHPAKDPPHEALSLKQTNALSAIGHAPEAFHSMNYAPSVLQRGAESIDAVSAPSSRIGYEVLIERMKAFNKLVDSIAEVYLVIMSSAARL
jgi:hypothetical protein